MCQKVFLSIQPWLAVPFGGRGFPWLGPDSGHKTRLPELIERPEIDLLEPGRLRHSRSEFRNRMPSADSAMRQPGRREIGGKKECPAAIRLDRAGPDG